MDKTVNKKLPKTNTSSMCEWHRLNSLLIEVEDLFNQIRSERALIELASEQLDLVDNTGNHAYERVSLLIRHYEDATRPLEEDVVQVINQARIVFSECLKGMAVS